MPVRVFYAILTLWVCVACTSVSDGQTIVVDDSARDITHTLALTIKHTVDVVAMQLHLRIGVVPVEANFRIPIPTVVPFKFKLVQIVTNGVPKPFLDCSFLRNVSMRN